MLDLDPIKARLAAATPGPWKAKIATFDNPGPEGIFSADDTWLFKFFACRYPDLALVENAPADLAAMVAEVERLRDAKLTLKDALYELIKQFRSDDVMSIEAALHAAERVLEDA